MGLDLVTTYVSDLVTTYVSDRRNFRGKSQSF